MSLLKPAGRAVLADTVWEKVTDLSALDEMLLDLTFNPAQPRDSHGRWAASPATALRKAIHGDVEDLEAMVKSDQGPTRFHMPQLSGVPISGSKADALPHQPGQEVDLTPQFEKELRAAGVSVQDTQVKISDLKPTQDQLVMGKVTGLAQFMLHAPADSPVFEPIFVSADNHVIDGHHRWAARQVRARVNGTPDETMAVRKIGLNIADALPIATQFMDEWGLPRAGMTNGAVVSTFAHPSLSNPLVEALAIDLAYNPNEPRRANGEWGSGPVKASVEDIEALLKPASTVKAPPKKRAKAVSDDLAQHLNDILLDYAFAEGFGPEHGPGKEVADLLKEHPELLKSKKTKDQLAGYPELTGVKPTYAQVSDEIGWDEMDASGGSQDPVTKASMHEEHEAQLTAQWWHDTLPDGAPEDQHYAKSLWEQYQNPSLYGKINAMLRFGKREDGDPDPEDVKRYAATLFDSPAATTLTKPMTVYRALRSSPPRVRHLPGSHDWAKELAPGTVLTDKGFVSSTAHDKFAQGWLGLSPTGEQKDVERADDVVMEIRLKPGQKIVGGSTQFIETMLPPGTSLRIVSSEKRHAPFPRNPLGDHAMTPFDYTHVVAEVVGP